MSKDTLRLLRDKIEDLDSALLKLLNERAGISVRIGALKAENSLSIYDRSREASIFGRLGEQNRGPLGKGQVYRIFSEILKASRQIQAGVKSPDPEWPGPSVAACNTFSPGALTAVYGILGNPVGQSMSPAMHNAAFRQVGIDAVYLPFEVSHIEEAISGMKALGIKGASVTHPFKTVMLKLIDHTDDTARRIGAVNTLLFTGAGIRGANTDWVGAVTCLENLLPIAGHKFVVLGAGGAARAVVFGVMSKGGQVIVVNRSANKGRALAEEFGCGFFPLVRIRQVQGDCLVNTTPVGMYPNVEQMPVPANVLTGYKAVADVVYNPFKTKLLMEAETAGCSVAGGFDMFLFQGIEQFRLWTGKEPPVELMREVVLERLRAS